MQRSKRMKKIGIVFLVLALLLVGCGKVVIKENKEEKKEEQNEGIVLKDYDETLEDTKEDKEEEKDTPTKKNKVVVIDPGHQLRGDSTPEPNGPGSSTMKARVTSGTTGVATRVPEYVMNLSISLKLRTELEKRGYTVYMTREVHEINISNKERAQYATTVGADIAVRIHGNGSTNQSVQGAEAYVPGPSNPYVSNLATASNTLGTCILDEYCKATGFRNRGVYVSDTMTGMNWSTVPVTILEVGFMSNAEEDRRMQEEAVQANMVQGIANGIDRYFGF